MYTYMYVKVVSKFACTGENVYMLCNLLCTAFCVPLFLCGGERKPESGEGREGKRLRAKKVQNVKTFITRRARAATNQQPTNSQPANRSLGAMCRDERPQRNLHPPVSGHWHV